MSEDAEQRLYRLFAFWTDAEVEQAFVSVRDSGGTGQDALFDTLWREYSRRTFGPLNVACGRCGSDNHTGWTHDHYVNGAPYPEGNPT